MPMCADLTRPWCLLELWEAHRAKLPVLLVPISGHGWSKAKARVTVDNLEGELPETALSVIRAHLKTQQIVGLEEFKSAIIEVLQLSEATSDATATTDATSASSTSRSTATTSPTTRPSSALSRFLMSKDKDGSKGQVGTRASSLSKAAVKAAITTATASGGSNGLGNGKDLVWEPWASDEWILAFGCTLLNQMGVLTGRGKLEWVDEHGQLVEKSRQLTRQQTTRQGSWNSSWLRMLTSKPAAETAGPRSLVVLVDHADPKALTTARVLQLKMQQHVGDEWLVSLSTADETTLSLEVEDASAVILLQTSRVLNSPTLLMQLYEIIAGGGSGSEEAPRELHTPLIPVRDVSGGYEFDVASETLRDLEGALRLPDLQSLKTLLEHRNVSLPRLSTCLGERLPKIISVAFDAEATELESKAFCTNLCKRLPEPGRWNERSGRLATSPTLVATSKVAPIIC